MVIFGMNAGFMNAQFGMVLDAYRSISKKKGDHVFVDGDISSWVRDGSDSREKATVKALKFAEYSKMSDLVLYIRRPEDCAPGTLSVFASRGLGTWSKITTSAENEYEFDTVFRAGYDSDLVKTYAMTKLLCEQLGLPETTMTYRECPMESGYSITVITRFARQKKGKTK